MSKRFRIKSPAGPESLSPFRIKKSPAGPGGPSPFSSYRVPFKPMDISSFPLQSATKDLKRTRNASLKDGVVRFVNSLNNRANKAIDLGLYDAISGLERRKIVKPNTASRFANTVSETNLLRAYEKNPKSLSFYDKQRIYSFSPRPDDGGFEAIETMTPYRKTRRGIKATAVAVPILGLGAGLIANSMNKRGGAMNKRAGNINKRRMSSIAGIRQAFKLSPKEKKLASNLIVNSAIAAPLLGGAALMGSMMSPQKRTGMSQSEQSKMRQSMMGISPSRPKRTGMTQLEQSRLRQGTMMNRPKSMSDKKYGR